MKLIPKSNLSAEPLGYLQIKNIAMGLSADAPPEEIELLLQMLAKAGLSAVARDQIIETIHGQTKVSRKALIEQLAVAEHALAIPKEAIRRQGSETGVLLLEQDRVVWRKVNLGISSYTKSQILSGLSEGDAAALPSEKQIQSGSRVQPVFQ